jgi:hypothetical protein
MKDNYSTVSQGTPDSILMKKYMRDKERRDLIASKITEGTATDIERQEYHELVHEQIALSKKIVQD